MLQTGPKKQAPKTMEFQAPTYITDIFYLKEKLLWLLSFTGKFFYFSGYLILHTHLIE